MSSEMESKPVVQSTEPVEQTSEPVVQSTEPVVQSTEPVESKELIERKAKPTFKELLSEYDTLASKIKSYDGEINSMKETIRNTTVSRNNLERQRNKIYALFQKCHEDEIKKALKRKNKRKGNVDGGFNKELDVPVVLSTFFGVDKDTKMTRPKVMSMLNNKFKELGLKNGQITTLDEKTASALGKESGRVIQFTGFQSFLKEFYDAENTNILTNDENTPKETTITV